MTEANMFLQYLGACGRSRYTLLAYARGLAHFFSWLHARQMAIDAVTRTTVQDYISDFAGSPKGGACPPSPARVGQMDLKTRQASPSLTRQPATLNHRLSVLAAFYAYHLQGTTEQADGQQVRPVNPVPSRMGIPQAAHHLSGRDPLPHPKRLELRQRVPKRLPAMLEPQVVDHLINGAMSWRDKAILTLLYRTGQRIGDWNEVMGCHGILGMTLADLDARQQTIVVRLKGTRDEHRVPVTDDFWPLYHLYLRCERPSSPLPAVWLTFRKGRGCPLTYATFESSIRCVGRRIGAHITAHMFRHTLAQAVLDATGNLKVVQELLGHAHISTTADTYVRVDLPELIQAVTQAKSLSETAKDRMRAYWQRHTTDPAGTTDLTREVFVFPYDDGTVQEFERLLDPGIGRPQGDDG